MPHPSNDDDARDSRFRAVAKSLVWVYILAAIGLLIPLATIPFLARVLGPDAWGRVLCAQAVASLFVVVVEYGFNLSGTRRIAYAVGKREEHANVVSDVSSAKIGCALAVIVLAFIAYWVMPIFRGHASMLVVATLWGIAGGWNFGWYFQGTQRPTIAFMFDTMVRLLGAVATFTLIRNPDDEALVVGINAVVSFLALAATLPIVVSEVGWPRLSFARGWSTLKESRSLASYVVVAGLRNSGNRIIMGFLSSAAAVATFGNAERLVELMIRATEPASRVIYPLLCEHAAASNGSARKTFFRAAAVLGSIVVASATIAFVFADQIIYLMCGPGYDESVSVLRLLAILPVFKGASMIFNTFWAQPHGHDRHMLPGVVLAGLMTLISAAWLVPHYGAFGMATAAVMSEAAFLAWSFGFLAWNGHSPFHQAEHIESASAPALVAAVATPELSPPNTKDDCVKFSIIVSTIGRIPELQAFLQALAVQTYRDWETIIVDQSGSGEVETLCATYRDRMRIQHAPMNVRGLSRARNYGLKHAGGEIVTFADDDCVYPPDLLASVVEQFDLSPEIDGLTVRSENEEGTASVTRFDREPGRVTKQNMFSKFIEFGLFLKRDVAASEPFDEIMGVGAGTPWAADEGLDLMVRLLRKNVHIEYRPGIVIYHPAPQLKIDKSILTRMYSYGCGRGRLFRKHRFPPRVVMASMVRTLGGAALMLVSLRWSRARAYSASFRGKFRGLVAPGPLHDHA